MRIGVSLFLIALGAILRFAVTPDNSHGFNIGTAGVILMIVGAIGLVMSTIWMTSRRRTDVVERVDPAGRRTTYMTPNDPTDPRY